MQCRFLKIFSSVQSNSVMSNSLWTHGLQHVRLPCPSPTHRACSNSCLSTWWCHPTNSSSVIPFSSYLQSFLASGSFPVSQFTSGGQSIRVSASASVLPMNIQDWFPLGLTGKTITLTRWTFVGKLMSLVLGDCTHEIKRCLPLGRKVMTNLDSIFKTRGITLPTKVHLVKAMVFPVVMYGCGGWTIKKAEDRRIDAFELLCWRRLLRIPWLQGV